MAAYLILEDVFFRNGQEILFETDSGDSADVLTTFLGITAAGGNAGNTRKI